VSLSIASARGNLSHDGDWMKAKAKLQVIAEAPKPDPKLIDEFGSLDRQVQKFKSVADRHKVLKEQILGFCEELPAEKPTSFAGLQYEVSIGARQVQRCIVDMAKVYRAIGKDQFLEVCGLTLKALERELGTTVAAGHLEDRHTGPRKVTAVAMLPVAVAA